MRYAMMIDLQRCIGCQACVSSCKEQWDSGPGAARNWVHTLETGRRGADLSIAFYPGLCMQCAEHPCTPDCPTGATFVNPQGVVVVDPDLCIGCGNCVSGCPYGARRVDPVNKVVEKCDLCAPLVARGEPPACVVTCPAECRQFGDLDDPSGALVRRIAETGAKPLVTADVNVGPKITYAGDRERQQILASGAVRPPERAWLTNVWQRGSLPFARYVVPAVGVAAVGGGMLVNLVSRRARVHHASGAQDNPPPSAPTCARPAELLRHRLGMRFLHWFNALSWLLLFATGTALISAKGFAFFGQAFPETLARLFGGASRMLRFHALWGLLWAAVVVPLFLLYKRGGREALEEVRLRREDLRWLLLKPLAMLGLAKQPLPPQDKYNAGQKLFAITAVLGTATIIATGLVMTFHIGSSTVVALAILLHKAAIALILLGLAVHITMAAVIREERPALRAMFKGTIDRAHAERHHQRWVQDLRSNHERSAADEPGSKP